MNHFTPILILGCSFAFAAAAQELPVAERPAIPPPSWAFPAPSKRQPPPPDRSGPIQIPGSAKTYTQAEIDDLSNPPDWFPEEHGAVPKIILHSSGMAPACGSCHLMSGHGRPETADLAGLPVQYFINQLADFKSGARKDLHMTAIGAAISDEDARKAAAWFASLKREKWVKVVEAEMVPKSYVSLSERIRLPWPNDAMEPIKDRIIELPQDPARALSRDPHSGFIAYVPKGSIAQGEALVKTGGDGKTTACATCHGDALRGTATVPRLAGLHPTYIVRQLLYFHEGVSYTSQSAAPMKSVVTKLTLSDITAIAAYLASLTP